MEGEFYERARRDQGIVYDFLMRLITSTGVEIKHKLKAASMILDRGAPAVKRVEVRHFGRVEFTYNSPQLAAARVLELSGDVGPTPAPVGSDESEVVEGEIVD